jgi:hypothetical protein
MDDPGMKGAEKTGEVLKGLEYMLKKRVFSARHQLLLVTQAPNILDMEPVYAQSKRI